jgi:hypothetical protein
MFIATEAGGNGVGHHHHHHLSRETAGHMPPPKFFTIIGPAVPSSSGLPPCQ